MVFFQTLKQPRFRSKIRDACLDRDPGTLRVVEELVRGLRNTEEGVHTAYDGYALRFEYCLHYLLDMSGWFGRRYQKVR